MPTQRIDTASKSALFAALVGLAAVPAAGVAQTAASTPQSGLQSGPANGVGSAFELTFWQSVTGSEDSASYEAYLARYPDGTFSGLARARIAAIARALAAQPVAAPTAVPAPTHAPDQAPAATPAVLAMPQGAAPTKAEMIPAANLSTDAAGRSGPASVTVAEAAPSPLARLLAQLRGNGDPAARTAPPANAVGTAALVTPAQPVQPPATEPATLGLPAQTQLASSTVANPGADHASARPLLLPVPDVLLPAYFCSNDMRNEFHNNAYRPAVEVATRNNEAAVGYLRQLQQTYDRGQLGRDTTILNAIAAEARAYQAEAARTYTVQAALVRQFDALMAVPLRICTPQPPQ